MRRALGVVAVGGLVAGALAGARGQEELTGERIMRHVDQDHRSDDERGEVRMILLSDEGERRERRLEILVKSGEEGDDMNIMRFLEPPTVRGTAVLTVEVSGRADDQWLYLPALKKSKRIASSQRTQRFAGTDFTFEDLRSEDFEHHTYELEGEAEVRGHECYVVVARPTDDYSSGYSKREIYVDKERFLTHEVRYYDPGGEHKKTLENADYVRVEGLWRARRSRMQDHQRGTQTLWQFDEREIDPGLSDSVFTVRYLERGL